MNLFTSKSQMHPVNAGTSKIKTPLGDVGFDCEFSGKSISDIKPSQIEAENQTAMVFSWLFENAILEFLKLTIKPKLPLNLHIDDCICGIWRIKALRDISEGSILTCKLNADLVGSPESGEGLECQSFENEDFKLSIGTEDLEYLCRRAKSINWLPPRFEHEIDEIELEYLAKGIRVTLPNLFQGETAQIQFIVAWSSKKNPEVLDLVCSRSISKKTIT